MAVANTVAALGSGADECHATINGLGERAGNAALEEIVITLRVALQAGLEHQNRIPLRHIAVGFTVNGRLHTA